MNKETVLKLIKSPTMEDKLLGIDYIKYLSYEELMEITFLLEGSEIDRYIPYDYINRPEEQYYKISDDLFAYLSVRRVIFRTKNTKISYHPVIEL